MQNHYNLLYREEEREMMGLCAAEGIGVIPWSPLARGRLTRPWDQKDSTERAATDEFGKKLYGSDRRGRPGGRRAGSANVAGQRGLPLAQVALAWVLSKPFVTSPIIGATKPNHLDDAVAALSIKLTQQEIARLEEPYSPHPVVGFL